MIVSRGLALHSAAIAHLSEFHSQFCHNALVHVADDGEVWVVEAYLERGASVRPLEAFLADGQGRAVVLRHRDPELARRAARAAFRRIRHGPPILYDAEFDSENHARLFCSEIARWACGRLVGEPSTVPLTLSRFGAPGLFDALGVRTQGTSTPADLLFDPRFDLIAEWRDPDALLLLRRHDAVVEALLSWMADKGYTLRPRLAERLLVAVGHPLRQTPILGLALAHLVSRGVPPRFLVAALAFRRVAQQADALLEAELAAELEAGRFDPRHPVTRRDLLTRLEEIRRRDLARWREHPRRARLHRRLRPGEAKAMSLP